MIQRLEASTESYRYVGVIRAYSDRDNITNVEIVWRCNHSHLEWQDAFECGQNHLKEMMETFE